MRKCAALVFALSAFAMLPGVVGSSPAGDLLFDDFRSYPYGAPIRDNAGGWIPLSNVLDDPANNIWAASDNQAAMQLYGAHSGCSAAVANHEFPVPDNAAALDLFVRFDMKASGEIDDVSGAVCPENLYDIQAALHIDNAATPASSIQLLSIRNGGWSGMDNLYLVRNRRYNVLVKINRAFPGMKEYWVDGAPWAAVQDNMVLIHGAAARFVAFSSGGGKGWVERVRVFNDTVPPVTTAYASGTAGLNGWYRSSVVVSLYTNEPNSTWSDGSGTQRTEYSRDAGGHWTTCDSSFTESAEGVRAIDYRSVDNAGNVEAFKVLTLSIDKTAPVTTASLSGTPGDNGWYVSDVAVSLPAFDNASGVASTEYSLDNTAWVPYGGPFTVSAEGAAMILYRSADAAGNVEGLRSVSIAIDKTPPTSDPAVFPAGGATRAPRATAITVTYGEAVFQGAGFAGIEVYNMKTAVAVAATASIDGTVLSISPQSALAAKTRYRVTIPAQAVKDAAGNGQPAAKVWEFTTGTK